jgi:hypothetical protein
MHQFMDHSHYPGMIIWGRPCRRPLRCAVFLLGVIILHIIPTTCTWAEEHPAAADPDQVVASWKDVKLNSDDFYRLLNQQIKFKMIYDYESLEKSGILEETLEECMTQEYATREAIRRGAGDDRVFNDQLLYIMRKKHLGDSVGRQVKPDLPTPEIIDMSPPDEQEMLKYFPQYVRRLMSGEFYRVHFIFFKKMGDDPEKNEVKKRAAQAALERIRAGEDFVEVKMEVTEAERPTVEPTHISRTSPNVEKIRKLVMTMKPGEISDVIEASQGYYIIYLLPTQAISEEYIFEEVVKNPVYRKELGQLALSKRKRTDPWADYLKGVASRYDYEEFDVSGLEEGEWPPLDTVLVRVDSDQWTLGQLATIAENMGRDPEERIDLDYFIPYLRKALLLSRVFKDEGHSATDYDLLMWRIRSSSEYAGWLQRFYQREILESLSGTMNEDDARRKAGRLAFERVQKEMERASQEMDVLITLDTLDMDRIEFADPPEVDYNLPEE